jgi:hypothetical protein
MCSSTSSIAASATSTSTRPGRLGSDVGDAHRNKKIPNSSEDGFVISHAALSCITAGAGITCRSARVREQRAAARPPGPVPELRGRHE